MRLWKQLVAAADRWKSDDGNLMAAAVAYYAALSFFPLLIILTSGLMEHDVSCRGDQLGMILQFTTWGHGAQQEVLDAIEQYASTSVRSSVEQMLDQVAGNAAVGGPLGILGLLISAAALFAHFDRAFDRIWNVESPEAKGLVAAARNIVFHRMRAFVMLLALGALLLVNLMASFALSGIRHYSDGFLPGSEAVWAGLQFLAGTIINTFVFALMYWIVPKVSVRFREALRGGLVAAVIWEMGRWILASFVLGGKYGAYGVIGSFLVVMLWIYYASAVLFLGAEYVQVICRDCNPESSAGE